MKVVLEKAKPERMVIKPQRNDGERKTVSAKSLLKTQNTPGHRPRLTGTIFNTASERREAMDNSSHVSLRRCQRYLLVPAMALTGVSY